MLSRPRFIVPLLALLAALYAGCGGGEQSGGPQEDEQQGQQQESKKQAQETKIALGEIARVNPENNRRIVLRPNTAAEEQEGGSVVFKVRKNARIVLGGQQAEVGDIEKGQQAKIEYIVENDVNRAVAMELFEAGGDEDTAN